MVGCFSEKVPFYIDVWAGGKFIELEDMSAYLGLSTEEFKLCIIACYSSRYLARGCRNLVHHYSLFGKSSEANMFKAFVDEFEKIRNTEKNASSPLSIDEIVPLPSTKVGLGVLGRPIAHSISPILHHHAALANLSLNEPNFSNWKYERIDVDPKDLSHALTELQMSGYIGLNQPFLKVEILRILETVNDEAKLMEQLILYIMNTKMGWIYY